MKPPPGSWPPFGSVVLGDLVRVSLVAAAYYATGRLGLLLAIPPGYATAIWPAAGIALAAVLLLGRRALPGILAGSFLVNLPTGWEEGDIAGSLWLPLLIGLGATLQAAVGAFLVRRWVGYRNLLSQELDAVRLLMIGGPLACLISATVGVTGLWLAGKLPSAAFGFNWFTWWVGDSIGVVIMASLVLIWSVRPYATWLRQQLLVSVPLVVLFGLVVVVFVFTSQREQLRIESEFRATAAQVSGRLQDDLQHTLTVLSAIEGYFASTDRVERHQFEIFSQRLLPSLRGGLGLSWNPWVPGPERAGLERAYGFEIFERAGDGSRQRAAARAAYVPISAFVPYGEGESALGFDVLSERVRREALERARDGARPVATRRLELVQRPGRSGVLVFMPIYRSGVRAETVEARRKYLLGFAAAIFEVDELLRRAVRLGGATAGIAISLVDTSDGGASAIYLRGPVESAAGGLAERTDLDFASRRWQLDLRLPERELVARRSWQSWLALAAGLFLTAMAGMLMLLVTGRSVRVEALVAERTAALREREGELKRKAAQLVASNAELEQFAYIASHDLKAPLRSIASFAQLVERRSGGELKPEAREFLAFIRDGVDRMQALVDDLLRLSRVEAKRLEPRSVALAEIVAQARQALAADIASSGAQLHVGDLPEMVGDPRMLLQLFQNLIGNAIKFQRPGTVPEVWISAHEDAGILFVSVRDNGIGVEPRFLDHIFHLFKRLHTPDQYPGTGLGLAICRKVVQLHGGEIRAESEPGKGLAVHFTLLRELPA